MTIAATTVFSLTLGYVPAPGDQYTLINLAPGFIGGTFAGLPEGGTQTAIFGGNNARLYNLTVPQRNALVTDRFAAMKAIYEREGPNRSNVAYGYVARNS